MYNDCVIVPSPLTHTFTPIIKRESYHTIVNRKHQSGVKVKLVKLCYDQRPARIVKSKRITIVLKTRVSLSFKTAEYFLPNTYMRHS